MPLFMLIFVLVGVGVVVGGIAAWLRQHKWRMRARRAEAEARDLRARLDAERAAPQRARGAGGIAAVRRAAGGVNSQSSEHDLRIVTADDIDRVLRYDALIDALAEAFRADIAAPDKIAYFIPQPSGSEAKILLMPAWTQPPASGSSATSWSTCFPTTPSATSRRCSAATC